MVSSGASCGIPTVRDFHPELFVVYMNFQLLEYDSMLGVGVENAQVHLILTQATLPWRGGEIQPQ